MMVRLHSAYVVGIDMTTGRVCLGLGEEGQPPTEGIELCPCHGAVDLANEILLLAGQAARRFPQHRLPPATHRRQPRRRRR